jgi:tRNA A-37 threonylcarbamoyl transferase component Bud32
MDKKQEVEEVKENTKQAEGYVEAVKSGFREIGDAEGEEKADEALEKISEIREHVRKRTEEGSKP